MKDKIDPTAADLSGTDEVYHLMFQDGIFAAEKNKVSEPSKMMSLTMEDLHKLADGIENAMWTIGDDCVHEWINMTPEEYARAIPSVVSVSVGAQYCSKCHDIRDLP